MDKENKSQQWIFRGACLLFLAIGLAVTAYGESFWSVIRDPYLYLFSLMAIFFLLPFPQDLPADSFLGRLFNSGSLFFQVLLRRDFFFDCSFALLGHLCIADGEINEKTLARVNKLIDKELKLKGRKREQALRLLKTALETDQNPLLHVATFARIFAREPATLILLVDMLLKAAAADGTITANEERLISTVAVSFKISRGRYRRLRCQYIFTDYDARWEGSAYNVANDLNDPLPMRPPSALARAYAVLDCSPASTIDEIKRNYRKLVRENHPDTAIGRRMSEQHVQLANQKFREIQEAYELVAKEREIL